MALDLVCFMTIGSFSIHQMSSVGKLLIQLGFNTNSQGKRDSAAGHLENKTVDSLDCSDTDGIFPEIS